MTCSVRYHQPYRPEGEGHLGLPGHEFGLEVIALVECCTTASTELCPRSTPL